MWQVECDPVVGGQVLLALFAIRVQGDNDTAAAAATPVFPSLSLSFLHSGLSQNVG